VLEGILWILRSGARWCDLPEEFPSPSTCWRRLRDGEEQEVWLEIWRAFLSEWNERQQLKWREIASKTFAHRRSTLSRIDPLRNVQLFPSGFLPPMARFE
jgi:transposase